MDQHLAKPPRLGSVFERYTPPLFFVTCCTFERRPILAADAVHQDFRGYALKGAELQCGVGRYVIMPDHLHLFVRLAGERSLGTWIRGLKRAMGLALRDAAVNGEYWQPGFFDHLVRHTESYAEKWVYVRDNPVRKGLALRSEDWPYQGEIVDITSV